MLDLLDLLDLRNLLDLLDLMDLMDLLNLLDLLDLLYWRMELKVLRSHHDLRLMELVREGGSELV